MLYLDRDEVYPVTRITTGVFGEPGGHRYLLQAQFGPDVFSWMLNQRQAMVLVRQLPKLLADIQREYPELQDPLVAAQPNLALSDPVTPLFRVGRISLGYDRIHDLVVLTLIDADALVAMLDFDENESEQRGHQIYATRGQALLLSQHTEQVVAAGRPYCPVCDEPIDETGHFCMPATARDRQTGELLH